MDRLSQLQTCLDQLVTQFFSALNYINRHHDLVPVREGDVKIEDTQRPPDAAAVPEPEFKAALTELAQDIVTKSQQIETLIDSLPALENVHDAQLSELEALEKELQEVREEENEVFKERKELLGRCDKLIMQITKYKADIELYT